MYTENPTVHCTSCSASITLAYTPEPAKYCPHCGSQSLISSEALYAISQAKALSDQLSVALKTPITLTPESYLILQVSYKAQTVRGFVSFQEYVACMLTNATPSNKKIVATKAIFNYPTKPATTKHTGSLI